MATDPTDLDRPPTEAEIASLLSVGLTEQGRMVIRRLAFQRDRLAAELRALRAENERLREQARGGA